MNGVLRAVKNCKTHFYLTGGTALSRVYYKHRYSDDLDFFVNRDLQFNEQVELILGALEKEDFFWDKSENYIKAPDFRSLKIQWNKSDAALKLDFVNDSAPHFGGFLSTDIFNQVDSVHNILTNKMGAIFRHA